MFLEAPLSPSLLWNDTPMCIQIAQFGLNSAIVKQKRDFFGRYQRSQRNIFGDRHDHNIIYT